MKVQMVTREPTTGVFVVSRPVELEEMAALGEGLIDLVPSEGSLGRLFPEGEAGMVVAMFLSQGELREKRVERGMARLFGVADRGGREGKKQARPKFRRR